MQGILGRQVAGTFGNFDVPLHEGFGGFGGRLGWADRPDDSQLGLMGATDADRVYVFFAGPPFQRGWFSMDERTFVRGARDGPNRDDDVDEVMITLRGANVIVTVPTDEYLRRIDADS